MGKASRRKRETREALEAIAQDPEVKKEFEGVALQAVREKMRMGDRLRVAPAGASRRGAAIPLDDVAWPVERVSREEMKRRYPTEEIIGIAPKIPRLVD